MIWIILLFVMGILWAGSNSVVKMGLHSIDPIVLVFWRFFFSLVIIAIWVAIKRYSLKVKSTDILRIIAAGILLALSNVFWIVGIDMSHVSDVSLLYAFEPVWGIILASLLLKEKLRKSAIIGFICVLVGLAVLSNFDAAAFGTGAGKTVLGNLIIVAGLICEGFYSIVIKPLVLRIPALVVMLGTLAVIVLITSIPFYMRHGFSMPIDRGSIIVIAYLSVICTVIGYTLWLSVMRYVPVNVMFFTVFIQPIAGPFIAVLFLGEFLGMRTFVGGAVLMLGMFIAVFGYTRGTRRDLMISDETVNVAVGGV